MTYSVQITTIDSSGSLVPGQLHHETQEFETQARALAFLTEECKWESTIQGVVRLGEVVVALRNGDYAHTSIKGLFE